jgi:hypothetical protein
MLANQNAKKCQSWVLSKVVQQQQQVVEEIFVVNEQVMDEQEQRFITKDIYDYIKTKLWICLCLKSWKLVMGKTLSCAIVFMDLPNHILQLRFPLLNKK